MENLGKVINTTRWSSASNTINYNSEKIYGAITALEGAAFKNKGLFASKEELIAAHPSPEIGSFAYVLDNGSASDPFKVYEYKSESKSWEDTGKYAGGAIEVNIDSKQDKLKGYRETSDGANSVSHVKIGSDETRIDVSVSQKTTTLSGMSQLDLGGAKLKLSSEIEDLQAYLQQTKSITIPHTEMVEMKNNGTWTNFAKDHPLIYVVEDDI